MLFWKDHGFFGELLTNIIHVRGLLDQKKMKQ